MFGIQSIQSCHGKLNTLFDDAANCCLITKAAANSLKFIGEPIKMDISTAIGSKSIPSNTYQVPLIDALNVQHIITAFEVENISENIIQYE